MYRVMLVEDEIPIRNIIARMIDWESLGFELVYQADNGQMALAYLEEQKVDLIITDISMPFMDGLELCRHIRIQSPLTTVVILSGHSEFDYAQKAITLGVSNYILKPVTKESFTTTLHEIKVTMDTKYEAQKDIHRLRRQFEKSKDVLRHKYYINLIMGYTPFYDEDQKTMLDVTVEAESFAVAVFAFEEGSEEVKTIWGKDRPLLEFAIFNLTEELMGTVGQDLTFFGPGNQICMILKLTQEDREDQLQLLVACLEQVAAETERLFQVVTTVGLSEVCDDLSDLSSAYDEALTALEYRVLESSEKVILFASVEQKPSQVSKKLEGQLKRLAYAIKVGDQEAIHKIIPYVFSIVNYEKLDINAFRTLLMQMAIVIFKAYEDIRGEAAQDVVFDYSLFNTVFELNDLGKVQQYFLKLCEDLTAKIRKAREDEEKSHVDEACAYIQEHYNDPFLTVESLCKVLFLSPGHFSRLFKKAMGVSFVDYLTKVRMDKAKELLANTDQKMYEISRGIGYEDPNYFSYNFKKHTGMTPSQWRRQGR